MPLSLTIGATGRHSWLLVDVLEEDLEPCWNDAEKRGAGRHASPTRSLTTNACFAWRPWPERRQRLLKEGGRLLFLLQQSNITGFHVPF